MRTAEKARLSRELGKRGLDKFFTGLKRSGMAAGNVAEKIAKRIKDTPTRRGGKLTLAGGVRKLFKKSRKK